MKLNKTFLAVAAALPLLSGAALAESVSTAELKERVFGSVFADYYLPDTDKTESAAWNYMEKDWGYGIELGYYLNESWALRAEYAKLDLKSKLDGSDADGKRLGIDAAEKRRSVSRIVLSILRLQWESCEVEPFALS